MSAPRPTPPPPQPPRPAGPGRALVDLLPGARPERWELIERAFELVETWPGSFAPRDLHEALGSTPRGFGAAMQVIRTLLALGLIERTGRGGYIRYRVTTTFSPAGVTPSEGGGSARPGSTGGTA